MAAPSVIADDLLCVLSSRLSCSSVGVLPCRSLEGILRQTSLRVLKVDIGQVLLIHDSHGELGPAAELLSRLRLLVIRFDLKTGPRCIA